MFYSVFLLKLLLFCLSYLALCLGNVLFKILRFNCHILSTYCVQHPAKQCALISSKKLLFPFGNWSARNLRGVNCPETPKREGQDLNPGLCDLARSKDQMHVSFGGGALGFPHTTTRPEEEGWGVTLLPEDTKAIHLRQWMLVNKRH